MSDNFVFFYEPPCLTLVEVELEQGFTAVSATTHEGFEDVGVPYDSYELF